MPLTHEISADLDQTMISANKNEHLRIEEMIPAPGALLPCVWRCAASPVFKPKFVPQESLAIDF